MTSVRQRRRAVRVSAGTAPPIVRDEAGSILPLTLGYAVLAIVTVLVCVDATSLYLAQKRLDALADAAALAGADGFTLTLDGSVPRAALSDAGVRDQALGLITATAPSAALILAGTPDGVSARVTVAESWHPPVLAFAVPDGVMLHATATSRTALR